MMTNSILVSGLEPIRIFFMHFSIISSILFSSSIVPSNRGFACFIYVSDFYCWFRYYLLSKPILLKKRGKWDQTILTDDFISFVLIAHFLIIYANISICSSWFHSVFISNWAYLLNCIDFTTIGRFFQIIIQLIHNIDQALKNNGRFIGIIA